MGYNPKKIRHLRLAASEALGSIDNISIKGDTNIEEIKKIFPKQNHNLYNLIWDGQLFFLRLYSKITGDVIPPILE